MSTAALSLTALLSACAPGTADPADHQYTPATTSASSADASPSSTTATTTPTTTTTEPSTTTTRELTDAQQVLRLHREFLDTQRWNELTDTNDDRAARRQWIRENTIDPRLSYSLSDYDIWESNDLVEANDGPLSNIFTVEVEGDYAYVGDCAAYEGRIIVEGDLEQRSGGGNFVVISTEYTRVDGRWYLYQFGVAEERPCDPTYSPWDLQPEHPANPDDYQQQFDQLIEFLSLGEDEVGYDTKLDMAHDMAVDPWLSAIILHVEGRRARGEYFADAKLEGEMLTARQWADKVTIQACMDYTQATLERTPENPTGDLPPSIGHITLRREDQRWGIEDFYHGSKPCEL